MPGEAQNPEESGGLGAPSSQRVSLPAIAGLFAFIGLTSFGGGITAYIRRLVVTQKGW